MKLDQGELQELKKYTYVVYILQAVGFLIGLTAIIAVIINYIKDDDVRGTWLESHFDWQKATFWWGLLWFLIGSALTVVFIGYLVLLVVTIWLIYRIARGWIGLVDGKEMYLDRRGD